MFSVRDPYREKENIEKEQINGEGRKRVNWSNERGRPLNRENKR